MGWRCWMYFGRLKVLFLTIASMTASTSSRNVLFLVADDAGLESGAYGHRQCRTPHIDRLAASSVVFEHAFTSASSCSPSRSAILTGLPSHQNGMYGLHQTVHHFNSFERVHSLPTILAAHGVNTGIIGKKHVGGDGVYPFDFSYTEQDGHSLMQVGRNISEIRRLVRLFFASRQEGAAWFLYIGFHDPHRCGHTHPQYGAFCEKFGVDGSIPDWTPVLYNADVLQVPYNVQDTRAAREDLAAQYTAISRLDQGVGVVLDELQQAGHAHNTLVVFTSDNGPPFPTGRTNLYEPGVREPLIVRAGLSPETSQHRDARRVTLPVSLLDLLPTVLDWLGRLPYPHYHLNNHSTAVRLSGDSLMPMLSAVHQSSTLDGTGVHNRSGYVFISQTFHEVTMAYVMRAVRSSSYKLIHNIFYRLAFPIDQDFYVSATFQDLLNSSVSGRETRWYKTLDEYYHRAEWELFHLNNDPHEINNLAPCNKYKNVFDRLRAALTEWQWSTDDPWVCAPDAVLENTGPFKNRPRCLSQHTEL